MKAGSRDERPSERGAAHLLEHLCFKGIAEAPDSAQLARAMEGIGAAANAATDRESTIFWIHAPRAAAAEAARLIGAVATRPLLDPRHLALERDIVVEEIRSYADDPGEQASTALDRALFGDGPLGREIAGRIGEVRRLRARDVTAFHARSYVHTNMSVAVAGNLTTRDAQLIARAAMGARAKRPHLPTNRRAVMVSTSSRSAAGSGEGSIVAVLRDGEQAQFAVGLPALRREDPDAPALDLLCAVLGDGSASRLFLELREERGLVYDVGAAAIEYRDAGALVISGGADPGRLVEALELIAVAIRRLAREAPSAAELHRAREHLAGRLERAADDPRGLAEWHAIQRLLRREPQELSDLLVELRRVRPDDVMRVARRLVRGSALRVGLSAPAAAVRAVRRAGRTGALDITATRRRTIG